MKINFLLFKLLILSTLLNAQDFVFYNTELKYITVYEENFELLEKSIITYSIKDTIIKNANTIILNKNDIKLAEIEYNNYGEVIHEKQYYENGNIKQILNTKKIYDNLFDEYTYYDSIGNVLFERIIIKKRVIEKLYLHNKLIIQNISKIEKITLGPMYIIHIEYCENGKIKTRDKIIREYKIVKVKNCDGFLEEKTIFFYPYKYYILYHSNRKIKEKGQYKNYKKIGTWKYFDENGKIIKTERY